MDSEQIRSILERHRLWLSGDGGERADLSGADLRSADLSGAVLSGAYLSGADLRSADLSGADLSYADLSYADLRSADLSGAVLSGAVLSYADLIGADLSGADLSSVNLYGVCGNRKEIKSVFISEDWPVTYTSSILQIGCQRHTFDEWWAFSDSEIEEMDSKALPWWKEHKEFIRMTIERFPAK